MLNKVTQAGIALVIFSGSDLQAFNNQKPSPSRFDQEINVHFFKDAKTSANIFNLTRIRDRRDDESNEYKENLYHSSTLANIDFRSGLIGGLFGLDLGVLGSWDMWHTDTSQFSEISLIDDRGNIKNGITFYKAAARLEYSAVKANAGYIQPTGPGVLGVNTSFVPGTYRGGEGIFSYESLTMAFMWVDQYKKPWIYNLKKMLRNDHTAMDYVYSLGADYNMGNGISVMGGFGQGEGFIDLYKFKLTYAGHDYTLSYQFYGMNDQDDSGIVWNADDTTNTGNDIFDGLAYQHVLMSNAHIGRWTLRAEATYTQARGSESNFAFRPTAYNSGGSGGSNGSYEVWWDSRSDFNHNGEKAVFVGAWYDFGQGWNAGLSFACGWDGKPNTLNPAVTSTQKLTEVAYNADISYLFKSGLLKGTSIKLHATLFYNRTNFPSWSREFPNAFKDEKDVKLTFVVPLF